MRNDYSNLRVTLCDIIISLKGIEIPLAPGQTFPNELGSKTLAADIPSAIVCISFEAHP